MKQTKLRPIPHAIKLLFTEGRTAEFTYSDPEMAEAHWLQLDAQRVLLGQIIKDIRYERSPRTDTE